MAKKCRFFYHEGEGKKMANPNKEIVLIRHGETEWSKDHRHTSTTDLALTEHGRKQAQALAHRLKDRQFAKVSCSPAKRAIETCMLADFFDKAEIDPDLVEWHYGQYEGLTTEEIRQKAPNWLLFKDGTPGGETPEQVSARADRVIQKINAIDGDVLIFSHGHFLRALATRWIGLNMTEGKSFWITTCSMGCLGYERELQVIKLWNDTSHLPLTPTTIPPARVQRA